MKIQDVLVYVDSHIVNVENKNEQSNQENISMALELDNILHMAQEMDSIPEEAHDSDNANDMQLICEGELHFDGENYSLTYLEILDHGEPYTETTISFSKKNPKKLEISRSGLISTDLTLEKGKTHDSLYITPYTTFQVTCITFQVKNNLLTDGSLHFEYVLKMGGVARINCVMDIHIKLNNAEEKKD